MLVILRFLVFFFLLVVVPRVSDYAAQYSNVQVLGLDVSGIVATSFAIGLSFAVFLSTYASSLAMNRLRELEAQGIYSIPRKEMKELKKKRSRTQSEQTRLQENSEYEKVYSAASSARIAAIVFATIEGIFNVAEVIPAAIAKGQIVSAFDGPPIALFSAWVFAAFPTISVLLLAWVIAQLDRAGSFLNMSLDGLLTDITGNESKPRQPKKVKEVSLQDALPEIQPGVKKHPDIEALRAKGIEALEGKDKFFAAMYNRNLEGLDTKKVAKAFGVSRRSAQRWAQDLLDKREEAERNEQKD